MNANDFGCLLLNILGIALPRIVCAMLFLWSILCAIGTTKHALRIGNPGYPDAFKDCWLIWAIGLMVLVLCAFVSHFDAVNKLIDNNLGNDTKRTVAQVCAFAYLVPLLVITWRTSAEILRRLSR